MMYFFLVVAVVAQCTTSISSLEYFLNPLNSPSSIVKAGVLKSYDGPQYKESVVKNTSCHCGWSNDLPTSRIIGGETVTPNKYPFLANIALYSMTELPTVFCGGTIISQNHVLTARHCIEDILVDFDKLVVLLGAHNINEMEPTPTIIKVQQAIIHPKGDISLLVLSKSIKYNEIIGPACLPNPGLDVTGKIVKVIGWGADALYGYMTPEPKELDTAVVQIHKCRNLVVSEQTQMCTYTENQKPHKGDSGGPAVWLDPETKRHTLVGVVGSGIWIDLPVTYAKVEAFLPWLKQHIADTKPSEICQKVE